MSVLRNVGIFYNFWVSMSVFSTIMKQTRGSVDMQAFSTIMM